MRRYTLTFFREGTPVAALLLDLGADRGVEKWLWQGDSSVQDAVAPVLPNDDQRLYSTWLSRALTGAERERLTLAEHYEGEPFGEYDHYYEPDDKNGPRFR
jgi:hypothetical protein